MKVYKIAATPVGRMIDIENKQFYDILFALRIEHRQCANSVIRHVWDQNCKDEEFRAQTGTYPTKEERLKQTGYQSASGLIYSKIKKEYKLLNSTVLSACQQMAEKRMRNDRKAIYTGDKSIPNYNNTLPIELPKSSIHIEYDDKSGDWIVGLALLSNHYRKNLKLTTGILPFRLTAKKDINDALVACAAGKLHICGSKLKYDKRSNKYYLMLCVKSENENISEDLIPDKICLVHIGVFNAVECRTSDNDKPLIMTGGEIEQFRAKHEARRKSILKQRIHCSTGNIGHGRRKRIAAAYKESDIISNYRDTVNHTYSKHIVDYAVKNNCGVIQLENLKGVTERLLFLKNWSYFDLQNKISEKAATQGIDIKYIPYPLTDSEIKDAYNLYTSTTPSD